MQTTISTTNQPSGGLASVLTEPLTERDLDFSRLDRTVDRYQLLLLAKRVGKQAGFTPRMLQLLEYYLAFTTAKDWEEGSRPIVFQSLARTAMDLGVGERQIQKLEKRLFDIGVICWNDSGNHKRFGRRDPKSGRLVFAYGVDLTPLAYHQEELQTMLHEKQLYAEAWRATKREISETRRQIRERLEQLREERMDVSTLAQLEASYQEIAYELRSHIDLARLRDLAKRHASLHNTLCQKRETDATSSQHRSSSPTAPGPRKRSRSHAQKFAHQEQTIPIEKKSDGHGRQQPACVEAANFGAGDREEDNPRDHWSRDRLCCDRLRSMAYSVPFDPLSFRRNADVRQRVVGPLFYERLAEPVGVLSDVAAVPVRVAGVDYPWNSDLSWLRKRFVGVKLDPRGPDRSAREELQP